ncbi:MAG: 3'-5' exonuclease [Geminicoccaceae bacterium]
MRELFVDTETTGFINFRLPLDHPSQPHLVQLAMILRDDGNEVGHVNMVVRCPVEIPEKAREVHGYDQSTTDRIGVTPHTACSVFHEMAPEVIIAHNADFDRGIMEIALNRASIPIPWNCSLQNWFCTMKASESHCRIPATEKQIRAGFKKRGEFKQPKLEEALEILTGKKMVGAHDALADVRACAKVYDWLKKNPN